MQTTLVLLKPDAIERDLIGGILSRFESKGLKITGLKMIQLDDAIIEEHYDFLVGKPFFPGIKEYMKRTPIIAIALTGKHAINAVRSITGATNPQDAVPGSIRGDFGLSIDGNIIHASDSPDTAKIELERFFQSGEVYHYPKYTDKIV